MAIRDRIEPELPEVGEAGVANRATELTESDADRLRD